MAVAAISYNSTFDIANTMHVLYAQNEINYTLSHNGEGMQNVLSIYQYEYIMVRRV